MEKKLQQSKSSIWEEFKMENPNRVYLSAREAKKMLSEKKPIFMETIPLENLKKRVPQTKRTDDLILFFYEKE